MERAPSVRIDSNPLDSSANSLMVACVFSYDSRVFDEYKEQSTLFSENPNESSRLYVVSDNTDEVERRVRSNQESGKDNIFIRGINSI